MTGHLEQTVASGQPDQDEYPEEYVAMQFETADQQALATHVGMWLFLATETLFFGAMFLAYLTCRIRFPEAWAAGGKEMNFWMGTVNTALLLGSSLTVALAHGAVQENRHRRVFWLLIGTLVLGVAFLGIKFTEYYLHICDGLLPGPQFNLAKAAANGAEPHQVELFFCFYFLMTGFHAVHMLIGCCMLSVLSVLTRWKTIGAAWPTPIVLGGLYWHLIDIVWVFLYPMFYLVH